MKDIEVQIAMKLNKDIVYYHNLLIKNGFKLCFPCIINDIYYTKKSNFNNFTEKQIELSCEKIRYIEGFNESLDNYVLQNQKTNELMSKGYSKIFDIKKFNFQYKLNDNFGLIQLQIVEGFGLIVYYDNNNYYGKKTLEQRNLLINDLNTFGFELNKNDFGVDILRSLYYGTEKFSLNQNE